RGGFIESLELLVDDLERPDVPNDVMHGDEEHGLFLGEAEQKEPVQGTLRQIIRNTGSRGGDPLRLPPAPDRVEGAEIDPVQAGRPGGRHDLLGLLAVEDEGGAKRSLAADDLGETRCEGGGVEPAQQAVGVEQVVRRIAGVELRQEPEPALGGRQGKPAGALRPACEQAFQELALLLHGQLSRLWWVLQGGFQKSSKAVRSLSTSSSRFR